MFFSQSPVFIIDIYKLPIFYLPTGDTTKSAEDREVKEEEEEEEE
jgi:hypothetical protein